MVLVASVVLLMALFPTVISDGSGPGPVPGPRGDLSKNMDLKDAAFASFLGERPNSRSGTSVAGLGDVNGDGIDDIIIGASDDNEWGMLSGQAYLFLGGPFGLKRGLSLSEADASFYGNQDGLAGFSVAGAGDVNNDGLNDILIGSYNDPDGALQAGKAYLIFGKRTGWEMDTSLSSASASFMGTMPHMQCGFSVAGAGDVNKDGFDDILIGSKLGRVYLFFGKASGWTQNRQLPTADVSFTEEGPVEGIGDSVAGAGDVNGDGYEDILLGAPLNDENAPDSGQTYLILGRSGPWLPDVLLTNADASFLGESENDRSGISIAGGGDVDGDGYDDIVIGADGHSQVAMHGGKSYIIFGRSSGWSMDTRLSGPVVSFMGDDEGDQIGNPLSSAGDLNMDGLDDILISSPFNGENGVQSGKVHLIFGRRTGWGVNVSISKANASFMGETGGDNAGSSLAAAGDVDGDGLNEIVLGAKHRSEGENLAGKTYLVKGPAGTEPLSVQSISVFSGGFGLKAGRFDKGDRAFIEMKGVDGNLTHTDHVRVIVGFSRTYAGTIDIFLKETGPNTGVYRGSFHVPTTTEYFETITFYAAKDPLKYARIVVDYPYRPSSVTAIGVYSSPTGLTPLDKLDYGQTVYFRSVGVDSNTSRVDKAFVNMSSDKNASYLPMLVLTETGASTGTFVVQFKVPSTMQWFENITLTSVETAAKKAKFMVHTPVQVRAAGPYKDAVEDSEYRVSFYNFGYNPVIWTATKNAYWLNWNDKKLELYGTPRNNDVGDSDWEVLVTIEDEFEHRSSLEYVLRVINTPPEILTPPVTEWYENRPYLVDFNCDDDGQGSMTWTLSTIAPFLKIDKTSGVLSGTPIVGDSGSYVVTVQVHDGHGGIDEVRYNLTIEDENDPPQITTTDIKQVEQDTPFRRDYDVYDPDQNDIHNWTLRTDAEWLGIENGTGVLFGTPDGYDVGDWIVNITVTDQGGLSDSQEFTLKVLDIEDAPKFIDVPRNKELPHGTELYFDVNATDYDKDDKVAYSVMTEPSSNMLIDPTTGDLRWTASYRSMPQNEVGMKVTLRATDGQLTTSYEFFVKVTPTLSPYSQLVSPAKGARTAQDKTILHWGGTDPEDDPLIYILYLADTEAYITSKSPDSMVSSTITGTTYELTRLTPGKTYYWTVIPDDTCTYGTCTNGVFSFRVNNRPVLETVKDQFTAEGDEFLYKLMGSDGDQDDKLVYALEKGPSGMTLRDSTGMLVWTPKSGQAGTHTVKVNVTDGYEIMMVQFRIVVSEKEGPNIGLLIGIALGVIVLIIAALLLFFLVIKKKGEEEGGEVKEEEDEETKQLREELEQKERETGWTEGGAKPPGEQRTITSVPSSIAEAHAQDKTLKKMGYEELYGQPAPDKDEELTTEELKDELEKLAEQLRNAGTEDASIDLGEEENGT
jgi:hypothetical protein